MKIMKVLAALVFTLFIAAACGGSGSGSGDDTGEAGGSYNYDNESQTLTITIESSDFDGDCGPEPGTETFDVTEVTATTMVWDSTDPENTDGPITWTRSSGSPEDITGTWSLSFEDVEMTLVIGGDGSFSLSGTCTDSGSGGGGSSNPTELIGTWDLTEIQGGPDAGPVPPGTVTVVLTSTTFSVTEPTCIFSGTYTATSTTLTTTSTSVTDTTGDGSGDCGQSGEVSTMNYTVTSSMFTLEDPSEDGTMIFSNQ